jgi:NIPSNAP protein
MKIRVLIFTFVTICLECSMTTNAQNPPAAPPVQPTATAAPSPSLAKNSRCFELRTYYAAPGKLEELHARFRNHTLKLFKKHGMEVVGFWGPTDKEKGSENTLVYILAFPSREARDKSWSAFRSDPDWQAAAKESEKNGKLTEKIDSVMMMATDYSPIK